MPLCLARSVDISDAIFDPSWIGEVEHIETLSPSELWNTFYNTSVPVKASLPILLEVQRLWTNEYLVEQFGNEIVQTEPDREDRTTDYCDMVRLGEKIACTAEDYRKNRDLKSNYLLGDFVGNLTVRGFDRYVISMLPTSMAAELPFLPGFSCGLRRQLHQIDKAADPTQIHELNFWFSKGSTFSVIHYDMNHQIMCQVDGRKEWRFWDLRTEADRIPMWSGFYPATHASDDTPIDPLNVDLEKYPDFLHARWRNTTLNPGECLLIPSRHALHFVRSFPTEHNIGFSVHVSPTEGAELYECEVGDREFSALGKFDVMWPFPGDPRESGYQKVRMGMSDWKQYALLALRRVNAGLTLTEAVAEITDTRSLRSRRIAQMIAELEEEKDLLKIFAFAPLWREVVTILG